MWKWILGGAVVFGVGGFVLLKRRGGVPALKGDTNAGTWQVAPGWRGSAGPVEGVSVR